MGARGEELGMQRMGVQVVKIQPVIDLQDVKLRNRKGHTIQLRRPNIHTYDILQYRARKYYPQKSYSSA